jgi:hypothetical protein
MTLVSLKTTRGERIPYEWAHTTKRFTACSFVVLENGRVGVSVKILRPTDRSQNSGRTKSLSDSETGLSFFT